MADRGNLAYDLSVYEPKRAPSPKEKRQPEIKMKKNPAPVRRQSAFKFFVKVFAILAVMCAILYGKVETNALFGEIHDLEQELKNLQSENITLAAEYEARTSLKNVEDYAENTLGLKKLDKAQIEYVEIPGDKVIEIVETENKNIFVRIRGIINEIREHLGA